MPKVVFSPVEHGRALANAEYAHRRAVTLGFNAVILGYLSKKYYEGGYWQDNEWHSVGVWEYNSDKGLTWASP